MSRRAAGRLIGRLPGFQGLPADARPRLYLHGLSLGAFLSQETLPLLDLYADPVNGALWTGSPYLSEFWRRVQRGRHPDSRQGHERGHVLPRQPPPRSSPGRRRRSVGHWPARRPEPGLHRGNDRGKGAESGDQEAEK